MRTGKPQSNVWFPLHRILVAGGLSVYNNYFAVQRIISFIFGLAAFAGLTILARELFHRRSVTVLAAFLSAVFGPLAVLSVVPLTEIECITVIVFAAAGLAGVEFTRTILGVLQFFGAAFCLHLSPVCVLTIRFRFNIIIRSFTLTLS
jgi:hypothetical protein